MPHGREPPPGGDGGWYPIIKIRREVRDGEDGWIVTWEDDSRPERFWLSDDDIKE